MDSPDGGTQFSRGQHRRWARDEGSENISFDRVKNVVAKGLGDDAFALIRVMYETTVAVLFILQEDSIKRARIYQRALSAFQQNKMVMHWKRTPGLEDAATPKLIATAQSVFDAWSKDLPSDVNVKSHWSGLGRFEDAVNKIGHQKWYATLYRHTSTTSHASDFGAHVTATSDRKQVLFHPGPSAENVPACSWMAREVLWFLVSGLDDRLQLGHGPALARYRS